MTRTTFHFRAVDRSPELQRVVDILKQAATPISALEIMIRIKEKYQKDALNISTTIGEIGKNEGYAVLSIRPVSRQEQHRYVLLRAPGWQSSIASEPETRDPFNREDGTSAQDVDDPEEDQVSAPRICKLRRCSAEILKSGPPFCCAEHRDEYFNEVK